MKKDYTNQALIKGSFAVRCLLLIIQVLSNQIKDLFLFYFHLRKTKWLYYFGLALLLSSGMAFQSSAQCTGCTFNAPADGTNFNFNGNQKLCITANASNLGWNMNGTGNSICVATGVVWNQPNGGNLQAGVVIDVYGTLNLGNGFNVNGTPPNAVINVHTGAILNHTGGFGNGITINNDGEVNFTSSSNISVTGSFVLNNSTTGTVNALTTTNFMLGNNATINNNGTLHFANFENEEGYLNNNAGATLLVDRSMNNHGAFINNGDFQIPCTTLSGAAGATTCSFRVGDKGVGKEFISNACIKVLNGNVTFDGPGTINNGFEIGTGYNLTLNKTVTGTNGSFLVKGGTSTINLSGSYVGTNMKFYDVNTAGNSFDSNLGNNASSFTVSSEAGCSTTAVCSLSLTATPSTCTPATNTYNVTGTLTFANAPTSGTLTVSDGTNTQVFNAPFTSTQAYSLTGLNSNGASHTVTAIFSATPACTNTVTYTAPMSCGASPCSTPNCGSVTVIKN